MALDEGAVLVQVSRDLFMRFVAAKPRTLQIYLHKVKPTAFRMNLNCVCSLGFGVILQKYIHSRLAFKAKVSGTSEGSLLLEGYQPKFKRDWKNLCL